MMSLFQIHYSWESLYVHKFIPNINADLVCEVSCHLKPIEQNGMGERKDGEYMRSVSVNIPFYVMIFQNNLPPNWCKFIGLSQISNFSTYVMAQLWLGDLWWIFVLQIQSYLNS